MKVKRVFFFTSGPRPLYPCERTLLPNEWDAVWSPEWVRKFWKIIKLLALTGIGAEIAQSVWRLATGWTARGSIPGGGARISVPVQPGTGVHPTSYTMCTVSFPGVKWPRRGADHPPHLAPKSKEA